MSILKETSSQLNVPAPVPEEGLSRFGVLSQGMCVELWYDVWGWFVGCEPLLTLGVMPGGKFLQTRRIRGVRVAGQVAGCFGCVLGGRETGLALLGCDA